MEDCCYVVDLPLFRGHPHGFEVWQFSLNNAITRCSVALGQLCSTGGSVWPTHHVLAATASFMFLCFPGGALCRVKFRLLNFCYQSLIVCLDLAGSCLWWFWKVSLYLPFSGISTLTVVCLIPWHSVFWVSGKSSPE